MASRLRRTSDYETIRGDIAALKRQLSALFDHVSNGAVSGVETVYDDLSRRGSRSVDAAAQQVRAHPLATIALAAALGYAAAHLLRR